MAKPTGLVENDAQKCVYVMSPAGGTERSLSRVEENSDPIRVQFDSLSMVSNEISNEGLDTAHLRCHKSRNRKQELVEH